MTPPSPWRHVFAGSTFAATVIVGVFAGVWADKRWGSEPWGVLLGAGLGIVAGFYNLLKEFKDDSDP